tara:strand:+ start:305 stop:910 length:606 start_codon:yes stop_codon:yes gene_type:complete
MKQSLLTILRDKKTSTIDFRNAAHRMTHILAVEAFTYIKEKNISVVTPLQKKTKGKMLAQPVVLLPILRSGLAFLPVFLTYFQDAVVGFIGLKRDEDTAMAEEYYRNIPKIRSNSVVIILDPMIATGGSAVDTIAALKQGGVKEKQMLFVSLIAAKKGITCIRSAYSQVTIIAGTEDTRLNKDKFIVPGLGDFGDRYFKTE